ncbi:MAG: hypothetical protein QOF21_1483 [Actinomycetota bacterium]|jgi:hypothetical protein
MRRRPNWFAGGIALALAFGLAACGSEASALEQTEDNMAKLKAATIDLRLAASSGADNSETGPVGFRMKGPFELSPDHDLAVFNLTYTQLLGSNSRTTQVRSTGETAFVTTGGKVYRVADDDLAPLKVSDDAKGGFGDLGIAGWVTDAKVRSGKTVDGERTDVITGKVDAADLLSDLARVAGPLGGDNELAALDDAAGKRLQRLVRASTIEVVTGAKDRQLRSLHAVVDFGTRAPKELRKSLGAYADARIEVQLTLDKVR